MNSKNYFSGHSKIYATFRPTYPQGLYDFIYQHVNSKETAWDCATGNGQVAMDLAKEFRHVYATDISQQQIDQAVPASNIIYSVCPAEKTNFADHQFDLVTVGQALHWLKREAFYKEVKRVLKPDGLLAVWGYGNIRVSPAIDSQFSYFYNNVVGPYWDEARRLVENGYTTIEFPLKEIPAPAFEIAMNWNRETFSG